MKIALDVDGVLADVIISWLNYSNSVRPKITKHEITNWEFWKKFNIDPFDFYAELSSCWKNWISIPKTEEDLHYATRSLSDLGQVDIVTARERSTDSFVKSWLDHHDIKYDNYVSVIDGPMKADLDYDIFIDDSPLNAEKFLNKNKTVILYSQPWNQFMNDDKIHRVSNLFEAIDKITST